MLRTLHLIAAILPGVPFSEEIGAETHERTVVNISRIAERMTAKYGPTSAG